MKATFIAWSASNSVSLLPSRAAGASRAALAHSSAMPTKRLPSATCYLLLALSPIAAPRTLPFALTIGLLSAWNLGTWEEGRGRKILIGRILAGMSVAALIFLVMIGFRVDEFMTTLRFHASRNTGPKLMLLKKFTILGIARLPVIVGAVGMIGPRLRFAHGRSPFERHGGIRPRIRGFEFRTSFRHTKGVGRLGQ
jgi:hypothetical protein